MSKFEHFENLWEYCENFNKEENNDNLNIIKEISLKLSLYESLEKNENISANEKSTFKSKVLGEILWSITKLSYKENINVFTSLNNILNDNLIDHFSKKHNI